MFLIGASIELFSARPHVLQRGDLLCACQTLTELFCKLCKSNRMKHIRLRRPQIVRHPLKCRWQELFVRLAHLQVEVLDLTQKAVGLAGYNAPHHTRLVVMVKYPIIRLDAEDGAMGWLVLLSVRSYLILRKVGHSASIITAMIKPISPTVPPTV